MVFEMQAEIYMRGPITCFMDSSYLENGKYVPGTIVTVSNKTWDFDHIVSPVGWGVQTIADSSELAYWSVRNSWGTFWGDNGWFRIQQGVNSAGIESQCGWAVPTERVVNDFGPPEGMRLFPSVVQAVAHPAELPTIPEKSTILFA
jgi:cathepsin X